MLTSQGGILMTKYHAFSETEAIEYAKSIPGLFSPHAQLISKEIGDGNLNLIFRIHDETNPEESVIFKQALPYARVVGESWPLTLDRARIEREMLLLEDELAPGFVPKVFGFHQELALTVMEDLSDFLILRKGLVERKEYPNLADHLGEFLARTLFFTSDLFLASGEKKQRVVQFTNPELCKITEDLVFTDPYYDAETNQINPLIAQEVTALWRNQELKTEVQKLKDTFMTRAQGLVHGDLHTGSIMVTEEETRIIDPEFAFYGPIGFDIGAIFANLLLNFAAQESHAPSEEERKNYQTYLLSLIQQTWDKFVAEFTNLWKTHSESESTFFEPYVQDYMQGILQDAIGFAGCKVIRRVVGLAHVWDLDSIEDLSKRAHSERFALAIGEKLIVSRKDITDIVEALLLVRRVKAVEVR